MKLKLKSTLLLISAFLLFGCVDPTIVYKYRQPPVNHPQEPRALQLDIPFFYVVSPSNRDKFDAVITKENKGVFFALTPGDYEIMAANIQEMYRYIKQQKAISDYYRELLSAESVDSEE